MQEMWVQSLDQKDPLKKEMYPMDRGAWWAIALGVTDSPT